MSVTGRRCREVRGCAQSLVDACKEIPFEAIDELEHPTDVKRRRLHQERQTRSSNSPTGGSGRGKCADSEIASRGCLKDWSGATHSALASAIGLTKVNTGILGSGYCDHTRSQVDPNNGEGAAVSSACGN